MKYKWLTETAFCHRGLHDPDQGLVENSLSAFHAANNRGHGFELDVLLSKDGRAMAFHDVSLKRLTGRPGNIQDFTAAQLGQFNLIASSDHIPSLADVLSAINQSYPVLIEIKGDQNLPNQIAQAVYQDIEHYPGPVAIMSFYPGIISWFKKNAPQITRGLVATSINDGEMPEVFFAVPAQKKLANELAVDFIAYDIKALPNALTEYCRAKKTPVLTWTVRTEALKQKADQYTDNIIYENLEW